MDKIWNPTFFDTGFFLIHKTAEFLQIFKQPDF